MMAWLFSLFYLAAIFIFETNSASDCTRTVWGGPSGPGVDCIFPFVLNGKTYRMCTTANEGNKRPWCPTKVDQRQRVDIVSNNFGYCDPDCPYDDGSGRVQSTTTTRPSIAPSTRPSTRPKTTPRTTSTTTTKPFSQGTEIKVKSESGLWLPQRELQECGLSLDTGYIIGGSTAARGEFPFLALLGYSNSERSSSQKILYRCGGTLLNRKYVLTAAHCHDPTKSSERIVEVVIGEHDVALDPDCNNGCAPAQRFTPNEVIRHENYGLSSSSSAVDNDIALIRLDRLVKTAMENFNLPVLPVCLPSGPDDLKVNEFVVAGWGKIDNDFKLSDFEKLGVSSRMPQKLNLPWFDLRRCEQIFPGVGRTHICAGGKENQDSCGGDSGGPLLDASEDRNHPMTIYGIVSSGSRLCGTGLPGVYTRVDHYIDWIKNHLRP